MGTNGQIRVTMTKIRANMAQKKVLVDYLMCDTFVHRDIHLYIHVVTRV